MNDRTLMYTSVSTTIENMPSVIAVRNLRASG